MNHARKTYQLRVKLSNNSACNIDIQESLNEYFLQRREYKKLLKQKRKSFLDIQKQELWSLKAESPKTFWKKLNSGNKRTTLDFSTNKLFDYFNNLLQTNSSEDLVDSEDINQQQTSVDDQTLHQIDLVLNSNINIQEVRDMVRKLKNNKAPGLDMISAELLKNIDERFYHVFVHLFNKILKNGDFPEEWAIGIIVLLFKGGDKSKLDNYRGITLLSIFGKLFIGVLLQRLQNVVLNFQILHENQIAYRKGYQTSDHIFTLRAIIEHTFQVKKNPLYLCFVDFSKAFDSIDHRDLLCKLFKYGIHGNFLSIISSLYSKVKSCVRGNDDLTDLFSCSRGVRQGCLLSPLLFALFLNDLNTKIREASLGVNVGTETINTLLYADDLILLAENKKDMQLQLDELDKYVKSVKMKVNLDKTKIMVLRKNKRKSRGKSENKTIWKLGDKEIQECEKYKYLGVNIKSNGSFSEHIEMIKDKAQKSYFSLLAKSREWGGFQPRLFLYLFDHTIMPILNYASEVWGTNEWPKLEKLHLSACKYALGVKSSTTTDAVYAELGRYSVVSLRHVNILKFLSRLSNLDEDRYASKAFNMLIADADNGYKNWVTTARSLSNLYNIHISDNKDTIKSKVKQHFQSMIRNSLDQHISEDKKLKTFATFKSGFRFEPYLDILQDYPIRSNFAKLRLSAHNLQIEIGRYSNTPRSERFCAFCKSNQIYTVEDEKHFMLACPISSEERENMLNIIFTKFPSTRLLDENNLFIWLMTQEDKYCISILAKFINHMFYVRKHTFN